MSNHGNMTSIFHSI